MKRILPDTALTCAVCGESRARLWRKSVDHLLGGNAVYRAVTCIRCGTRRLDPRPDTMEAHYRPETYARAEEGASEVGKRLDAYAKRLTEVAGAGATADKGDALDIGCGDGRFMAALQKRGYRVTGTETDPAAAALAAKRTGATVYETSLPPMDTGRFDFVSLLHVLEHLPDPRHTLAAVRERLVPNGKLLLVLPNADSLEAGLFGASWYHLDLPRHLWGFSPRSLVRLVETCGFAVQKITYTPFLFAPQSLLRGAKTANGVIPGHAVLRAEGGESGWQTRVFMSLLAASDSVGKTFPGEIIELVATRVTD